MYWVQTTTTSSLSSSSSCTVLSHVQHVVLLVIDHLIYSSIYGFGYTLHMNSDTRYWWMIWWKIFDWLQTTKKLSRPSQNRRLFDSFFLLLIESIRLFRWLSSTCSYSSKILRRTVTSNKSSWCNTKRLQNNDEANIFVFFFSIFIFNPITFP